jgi:hypothetical protein|nr:MAG TPA: hypothetical protein [Caudoviricetes sp.]
MERLTKRDTDGQAMMDCQKCKADWTGKHGKPMADCTALYCRNRLLDRLVEYEDTGLSPQACAEAREAGKVLSSCDISFGRLAELLTADKGGRLVVLPCKVDGSMLNTSDPERPKIMKRIHFAVAYVCGGIVFHQPYNIFLENVAAGYIRPLNEQAEKALEAMEDE